MSVNESSFQSEQPSSRQTPTARHRGRRHSWPQGTRQDTTKPAKSELCLDDDSFCTAFEQSVHLTDAKRSRVTPRSNFRPTCMFATSAKRRDDDKSYPPPKKATKWHGKVKRRRNWYDRYDMQKGKKVSDRSHPMEMLFFDTTKKASGREAGSDYRYAASVSPAANSNTGLSRRLLISGRWRERDSVKDTGRKKTVVETDKR